ncbi:MAG: hypothetical protein RQM90_09000 [Methanoculleus sp.]
MLQDWLPRAAPPILFSNARYTGPRAAAGPAAGWGRGSLSSSPRTTITASSRERVIARCAIDLHGAGGRRPSLLVLLPDPSLTRALFRPGREEPR